jgi:tRNA pseudouridine13 synthase
MGKISKNLKIGMLQGNFFSIKTPFEVDHKPEYFINYYDTQRVKFFNINKGKELLLFKQKKFSKKENLFIDSYISYLWNESLKSYLKEKFQGHYLKENNINFFIPEDLDIKKIPKFWTVLGYKVKLEESKKYYKEILEKEGIELEKFLEILKHKKIKGDYRRLYEKVENFSIKGKYVSFFLKKGAYATMLLKFLYTKNVIFKP